MTEKRFTLAEAQRELEQRECGRGGHTPATVIHGDSQTAVAAYCRCGKTRWEPK